MLPRYWLNALAQPGSNALFTELLPELGFIPWRRIDANPDGLPIGFAIDVDNGQVKRRNKGREYVGLTCAACHTAVIDHPVRGFELPTIVEGGPALIDFQEFLGKLVASLEQTLPSASRDRFEDFRDEVEALGGSAAVRDLEADLLDWTLRLRGRLLVSSAPVPPGPGRVDAFGLISHWVATHGLGEPGDPRDLDAPVSYPFLWGTPQSDVVQWNGSAWNRRSVRGVEVGPVARNIGEVLGVFGEFEIRPRGWWEFWRLGGYASSIPIDSLHRLEHLVTKLRSPPWPADFGGIDAEKARAGRRIYARECAACHEVISTDREHLPYQAKILPVGTDPQMATRFGSRMTRTGRLEGVKDRIVKGPKFGPTAPQIAIVEHVVTGVLLENLLASLDPDRRFRLPYAAEVADGVELGARAVSQPDSVRAPAAAYKARPLNGIWATAPYLHNGSVPTLRHLLEPEHRPSRFCVGRRKFDALNVGYQWEDGGCPPLGRFDAAVPGNSNAGHEYGAGLSDRETAQLLEYLKGL